jgi:hypothetical protein
VEEKVEQVGDKEGIQTSAGEKEKQTPTVEEDKQNYPEWVKRFLGFLGV